VAADPLVDVEPAAGGHHIRPVPRYASRTDAPMD
jgi:hypothetical protein